MLDAVAPVPHRHTTTSYTASRIPAANPLTRMTGGYKNLQTLHTEKLKWDAQLAAERSRKRKLQEDREDTEWARSTGSSI
jgi:hypothetical protein